MLLLGIYRLVMGRRGGGTPRHDADNHKNTSFEYARVLSRRVTSMRSVDRIDNDEPRREHHPASSARIA
jgi:hypothetical protein